MPVSVAGSTVSARAGGLIASKSSSMLSVVGVPLTYQMETQDAYQAAVSLPAW